MFEETIEQIRYCIRTEGIKVSQHAEKEMADDNVSTPQLLAALLTEPVEVIEDYPEDQRGHSHLLLCWLNNSEPLHVCCAIRGANAIIITVYRPDPERWLADWRTRI